jgi:hypothetical protein
MEPDTARMDASAMPVKAGIAFCGLFLQLAVNLLNRHEAPPKNS